ncbi:hypothetical protein Desaci_0358 [Desulfosporosinus acidiphilus SJ4]|uniref:Uncharacterized protein n=1 Tax=Desulfosporosinus acidiphilus (strain DSM 22704 / JCM 16185 / SJ4) TaxID=646529 RepID=I4D0V2_DESAJ|nr:hypothetical protein [Desulfosporosinus acidiphilus]AFM39426.1 hypothetical protein Desaci_0358 [Desulfosporosinus acidiphilus SJ4]
MKAEKYKSIFKERWKFYLIGYLIAYFIPIILYGIPSWQYLFPTRIFGISGALLIGTAFYYGSKKLPVVEITFRSLKYVGFMLVLMLLTLALKELILSISGFDITPFIGIPNTTKQGNFQ